MKKLMMFFIVCCIACTSAIIGAGPLQNNIAVSAATYKPNTWYNGTVFGDSELETSSTHMRFKVPTTGYFHIQVVYTGGQKLGFCDGYVMPKLQVNHKELDHGLAEEGQTYISEKYVLKKGTTVDVQVNAYMRQNFKVRMVFVKNKNYEPEGNNTKAKANKLKKNKTITGRCHLKDTDWFIYKIPKKGTYSFRFVSLTDDQNLMAKVYNKSKLVGKKVVYEGDGYKTIGKKKYKKGTKLYIKIKNNSYHEKSALYKVRLQKY